MTNSDRRGGWIATAAAAALILAPIMLSGCGDRPEESSRMARRILAVDAVPDLPRGVAEEALPDVEFEDSWANVDKDGTIHSYELRGRNAEGRIREVRVSLTGEVLEME